MVALEETVQSFLRGRGKFREVERALDEGADPNQWEGAETPLICAVKANQARLVQLLIRRKVDVNRQDAKGISALHVATFKGRSHLVKLLLDGGANPNLKDCHGQTPIFFAPTRQICEALFARRADVTARNLEGQTPLHHASHAGFADVVAWFVEVMDENALDVEDHNGVTPVHYAQKSKVKCTHGRVQRSVQNAQAISSVQDALAIRTVAADTAKAVAEDAADVVRDVERIDGADESFYSHSEGAVAVTAVAATAVVAAVAATAVAASAVAAGSELKLEVQADLGAEAEEAIAEEAVTQEVEAALEEVALPEDAEPEGVVEPQENVETEEVVEPQEDAEPEEVVEPQEIVETEEVVEPQPEVETQEAEEPMEALCPNEHVLSPFQTPEDGFLCSFCEREFPERTTLYGCRPCDYDLCKDCLFRGDASDKAMDDNISFSSEHLFAQEAQAQIEEEDGCLHWQVLLKKERVDDKFGFVQANGLVEFESKLGRKASGEEGASALAGPELLIVRRIHSGGLLHRWNECVPELEVKPQDRIIGVNDEVTIEGMLAEIQCPRIMLQMMRFPERFIVTLSKEYGGKLGFKFERPHNVHSEEVRVTEVLEEGCMMSYNVHQANSGRFAYVVLPDMRIDRVNDCYGDAEAITKELKEAQIVSMHIRRCETALMTSTQVRQKLKVVSAFQSEKQTKTGDN